MRPELKICIVEKEAGPAFHQSSHNSGVIHSGIYYKPGGSKAVNCRKGYQYLLEFCDQYGLEYDICGKVIVATTKAEIPQLESIYQRGIANGLTGLKILDADATREKEPHVRAVQSIWVPQAGITNYKKIAQKYLELVLQNGGQAKFEAPVIDIQKENRHHRVITPKEEIIARFIISCGGLYSDKITKFTKVDSPIQILPFRGEYYELKSEKQHLVRNLIYPVPNLNFPFLGVHYTRMIEGGIEAGPNAVLAFKREGYSRWDIDRKELWETLSYPGFQKIARRYWRDGLGEFYRSFSKQAFVKALQHLIPEVTSDDLQRGRSGVRAMACDPDGNLLDDYRLFEAPGILHVANAPSPAATASLAIGEMVAGRVSG
ncbi:MAG: hydroxyglutarate oxidase [Saprospiraceae bacterium]|nr:MAG: hydroxyglutarate oxidase [Saprospiraceae bacterium]